MRLISMTILVCTALAAQTLSQGQAPPAAPAAQAPQIETRKVEGTDGVYTFRNERGEVIYVGKAASLKGRMRSYFGAPQSMELKTRALREHIADFEYVVTHTEQEALHLEATLVKRHQPFFNVRLKDDKHYPGVN